MVRMQYRDPNQAYLNSQIDMQQQARDNAAFNDAQDPAATNWRIAHFGDIVNGSHAGTNPNETPWGAYNRVLEHRGAQLNPHANAAEPGLPAGYTQNQLDTENADYLQGGQRPRWATSQNLPSSQQRIAASLSGLQRSMRGR